MTTPEELLEALDGFFLAAEYGRSDVIKALADHSRGRLSFADVVDPVTGRSPLHVAVASGKKDALRVLLAAGFPPEHQSKNETGKEHDNRSAYALAQELKAQDLMVVFHQFLIQQVAANDVQSVNQLLAAGVDVGVRDAATGGSLLHWAASCQALDVMKELLEREDVQRLELVNTRNGEGATPLHLACHANQVECVEMLLRCHADVSMKGDKGISKGKTAMELTTMPEVKELFSRKCEGISADDKSKESKMGDRSRENEGKGVEASCPLVATQGEQGESGADVHNVRNETLLLQLEEKDLLVGQLKRTIEALVQELQETRMLGEERVMLDYVRKLREEKSIIQRQLEDANDYIKDQQRLLDSLKKQIQATMSTAGKELETDHDVSSQTSDGSTVSPANGPSDSSYSMMSLTDSHHAETQPNEGSGPNRPHAQPLKLNAWASKAQREQGSLTRHIDKHGSGTWSTVWNGLWVGPSEVAQDAEDEVVITV
ncbi:unnamed protein product [Hyaloperonospora brassicae]|uniref:Uncharacterized protein n=1 Tax=Hyaloperonospora brassicae TaxID=162125 RepID=A0AAV0T5Q5_HYABA|nr:unnamed protein product [Hyaloperonospora brassicae]